MPETATISSRGAPPPRIVVADDHVDTRELIATVLSSGGFDVVAAPSGDAALSVILSDGADGLVGDFQMPGLDGVTLCRLLRGLRTDAALIPRTLIGFRVGMPSRGGALGRAAAATSPPQSTTSSAPR